MAYGGLNKYMDAAAEIGRNPVGKDQVQPEYGDEQADAGRDCRTCLRGQILRGERGPGNTHFPCSADHEQDWQPYPVDSYSAICDDHTYMHRATYILQMHLILRQKISNPTAALYY